MRKCIQCGKPLREYQRKYCSVVCKNNYFYENKKRIEEKIKREKEKLAKMEKELQGKIICPWEAGLVEGTAKDADPILGF